MASNRVCRECGKSLDGMAASAMFCSAEHRKAWNNRRMIRGAEMYDLVMALRFERDTAGKANVMSILTNLARAARDSDNTLRDGRLSWSLAEALDRLPLAYGKGGDKR